MRFFGIAESSRPVGSWCIANPDQGAAFRTGPVQANWDATEGAHPLVLPIGPDEFRPVYSSRVGRHQSPLRFDRHAQIKLLAVPPASDYHRMATCVLTGCLTSGDQPKLTPRSLLVTAVISY